MKTKLSFLVVGALLCFVITSCEKPENKPETVLDTNLLKSEEKYKMLMESRSAEAAAADFTIEDIQRNAHTLTITVTGGCDPDNFFLVWDGSIMLSSPGQVNLVLHTTSGTDCGTDNRFDIAVNLSKLMGERDPADFIFNVANGSAKQDLSLNPNGSVVSF